MYGDKIVFWWAIRAVSAAEYKFIEIVLDVETKPRTNNVHSTYVGPVFLAFVTPNQQQSSCGHGKVKTSA